MNWEEIFKNIKSKTLKINNFEEDLKKLSEVFTNKYLRRPVSKFTYPYEWLKQMLSTDEGRVSHFSKPLSKLAEIIRSLEEVKGFDKLRLNLDSGINNGYFWQLYVSFFINETIGIVELESKVNGNIDCDIVSVIDGEKIIFHVKDCSQSVKQKQIYDEIIFKVGDCIDKKEIYNSSGDKLTLSSTDINTIIPNYIEEDILFEKLNKVEKPGNYHIKVNKDNPDYEIIITTEFRKVGNRNGFVQGFDPFFVLEKKIEEQELKLKCKNFYNHFIVSLHGSERDIKMDGIRYKGNLGGIIPIFIIFDEDKVCFSRGEIKGPKANSLLIKKLENKLSNKLKI